mgnify:CR=1 FL=1
MSVQSVTAPMMLDTTGQALVTALNNLTAATQPTNVYVDILFAIPSSGWTNSSPYTYTWTSSQVTAECAVEVYFSTGSNTTTIPYLEYEKVSGGVKFTAPSKPSENIPVIIRILNADAEFAANVTADAVSTSAVYGASNVEQALSSVDTKIGNNSQAITALNSNIISKIENSIIFDSLSAGVTYTSPSLNNGSMIFIYWNDGNESAILMKTNSNKARNIYNNLTNFTISCYNNVVTISNTKSSSSGNIVIIQKYE